MVLNKDELQQRIVAITNEMIQTKANYAKLEGHLAESQHWLTDLVTKEAEADKAEGSEPTEPMEQENGEIDEQGAEQAA